MLGAMTNPGSFAWGDDSCVHAASRRISRALKLGVAVSLAALVGCSGDPSIDAPESQSGGLSPGNAGSSSGGGAGQGGASTSSPGPSGGTNGAMPSGGTEGSLPTDIPLGTAGANDGSTEASDDAGALGDAGVPPLTEPGFAPCPTDGTPCRIMPLGDSITDGIDMNLAYASNGGYRLELFRQAITAGHPITFVGAQPPNGPDEVAGQPFPRSHEGISGNTIQQVAARLGAALAANPPHIVLLQIGTNNLYTGMAPDVPGQLAGLIDQITDGAPDALVVVAQITPLGGQFANNGVDEYNAAIPGIVQQRIDDGKHLLLVDQFTRIATTPDFVAQLLPDNIHPNAAGYAILGETWYGAIEAFLP
jgi:lysophospholipase L1-like esterase